MGRNAVSAASSLVKRAVLCGALKAIVLGGMLGVTLAALIVLGHKRHALALALDHRGASVGV